MNCDPKEFVTQLKQLGSIPSVALRVIEEASKVECSLDDLTKLIESDPPLTTKVVRAANAAWLGYASEVRNLQRAVTLLGLDMTRCLALSVVISSLFTDRAGEKAKEVFLGLWCHSLGCAIFSELLAAELEPGQTREAFMAGLLHDIGKLVLLQWDWERYEPILQRAQHERLGLEPLELAELGVTHSSIGRRLMETWNFPPFLQQALDEHHLSAGDDTISRLGLIVKCANSFCHRLRLGESGSYLTELTDAEVSQLTGLDSVRLQNLAQHVLSVYDERAVIFDLDGGSAALYISTVFKATAELANMFQTLAIEKRRREETEAELRQREEQLNRARRLEALGQLAGGVAHDFNNLLTVIKGQVEMASDFLAPDAAVRTNLREIELAASRAASLTQQLLIFGKRQSQRPVSVDLNQALAGVKNMIQRLVGTSIEVRLLVDPLLKPVMVDLGQLDQALFHLCLNARDAMPDGGVLTLQTRHVSTQAMDSSGAGPPEEERDYALLRVVDTGMGMDEETRQRIFEPFFTTKDVGEGSGLGLATVYGVITQAGGHIVVNSKPGEGTTFDILIPSHSVAGQKSEEPAPSLAGILVVEDEQSILRLIERALKSQGFRVFSTESPEGAIECLTERASEIDLLITDVVMPRINGPELRRRLCEVKPGLKVLFILGYSQNQVTANLKGPFLEKPFTPTKLFECVRAALASD